jgi:hypothetical protein
MLRLGRGGGRLQRNRGSSRPCGTQICLLLIPSTIRKNTESCWAIFRFPFGNEEKIAALGLDNNEIQENRLQPEACSISSIVPRCSAAVLRPYNPTARRFPNGGNHNISFDMTDNLGVASSASSHIGSV